MCVCTAHISYSFYILINWSILWLFSQGIMIFLEAGYCVPSFGGMIISIKWAVTTIQFGDGLWKNLVWLHASALSSKWSKLSLQQIFMNLLAQWAFRHLWAAVDSQKLAVYMLASIGWVLRSRQKYPWFPGPTKLQCLGLW